MPRYAISLRLSSASHLLDPADASRTLCGLPAYIFGRIPCPLDSAAEAAHVHCKSCDRALAAARSVRSALVIQEARA